MTTPNLYSLEIRVGKCSINHHRQGVLYAVSIQIQGGKQSSPLSQLRKKQGNDIHFNTTLRLSVEKALIEDQNQNCILTLFQIQGDRSRNVIGKVEINIAKRIEKGFEFIDFKECIDPQATIELSVNYNLFELVMRSQLNFPVIGFLNQQQNHEQRLAKSRGNETIVSDFIDSNQDRIQQEYLKQSKAVSNLERIQPCSHIRSYSRLGQSQIRCIREKPDFSQSQPEEIVSHYEKQIQNYQNELKQKQQWALGMKSLVQQLEAQNQVLKELTLDELEESKIQNLEMGVDFISKIVKGKFQAAKLAKSMIQVPQEQPEQEQQERGLTQTISHKSLPKHKQQQETGINQALANICGNIDNSVIPNQQIYLKQISHLQQQLQKVTCEKNELYDTTEAMFNELNHLKQDKDIYINELKQAEAVQQQLRQYLETLKQDNKKLKDQLLIYEKSKDSESMRKISESNLELETRVIQLERQLKQSLKAIEEFKNDALSARQDIITKDEEISVYKQKLQDLASNTNKKSSERSDSSQKINIREQRSNQKLNIQQNNLHQMYSNILESSIQQRKKLQKEIQPFLSNIRQNNSIFEKSTSNNLQIRKLQNKVNKLFIDLVKNRESCLKESIDVEKHKRDITTVFKVLLN